MRNPKYPFSTDGSCPLCGRPWDAENGWKDGRTGYCDHEADWYRQWLAEATEIIDQLRGREDPPVST